VDRHLCSLRVPCDRERRGGSGRARPVLETGHVEAGLHTPFIYPNPALTLRDKNEKGVARPAKGRVVRVGRGATDDADGRLRERIKEKNGGA
jgi:hypothetical protein